MSRYGAVAEDLRRNDRQWAAYESKAHCVVLAGPGSGKTKVLTAKMARMLSEDVRPPRGIACITYNNQCVKELKKRLATFGVEDGARTFIGTVHSFCLREVVIPYAKLAGIHLADPLKVASPSEQQRIFGEAVKAAIGDENPQYLRTPFDEFRRTVLDRTSAEWLENERYAPLVLEYEKLLDKAGMIDFDAMALTGLTLIKSHGWVRRALTARFPILVVDEYQDLGIPLHQMVLHLCIEGGMRLFAVGDPDQSIYGFNGARPSLMNELAAQKGIESIKLRLNYRCGRTIIVASTAALAEARDFASAEDNAGFVQDYRCPGGFDEQVSLAIGSIVPEALKRREGRSLGDIGVLYQNQFDGQIIAGAVEKAGFAFVRFDQGNPYPRTPFITWLEDCASWCAGGWKVGEPRLSGLLHAWLRFNPGLVNDSEINRDRRALVRLLFGCRNPDSLLIDWLIRFAKDGLFDRIRNEPTMADELEALKMLYAACKDDKPLARYTLADFGGQRSSPSRLNLTTIHSAKGLEYDVVIMLGLEQGRIPYYRVTPEQEREARRLFYVAMTRARHEVHLLWSGWYVAKGTRWANGRSKFVDEVMQKLSAA
jgi:DNA helicase-2/ATP-dependent DNA helicase PcrA